MNAFDYFFEHNKDLGKDFIIAKNESISFSDLYLQSLGLALFLRAQFGEKKNILLISENSIFFVVAYLGIIKSGNICVPIDPMTEERNLEVILELSEVSVGFVQKKFRFRYEKSEFSRLIDEDEYLEVIVENPIGSARFFEEFDTDRPMEIIFTSGSTGVPKGVVLSHGNIIANTNSILEYLQLNSSDRMLVVLPFYYCYGLSLLHTHLRIGGSVVLNNTFMFLATIVEDLKKYDCTGFAGVPSHFQLLLKKSDSFKKDKFPHLRYVTQAGGKLHDVFIQDFIRYFPKVQFFVMYGQTEATARLSYLPPELVLKKKGSIGKGIPGVTLRVAGSDGEEVPTGQTGEILASGANIMKGYLKDEALTKKTIRHGWLHTGDLAIRDEEGFIYVIGREKEIIKVGGKRVSAKEIEAIILELSEILDCTITQKYDALLGESLQATVVLNENYNTELLKKKIINHCKLNLASYKIPSSIHFTSDYKLKGSGKK